MPIISEVSVYGYRGFTDAQVLRPAQPTGKPGSGLTILVGPNNGGKSALLEAIDLVARGTNVLLPHHYRNDATEFVADLWIRWSDGRLVRLRSRETNTDELLVSVEPPGGSFQAPAFVSTRRQVPSTFQPQVATREQYFGSRRAAYSRQLDQDLLVSRVSSWRLESRRFKRMLNSFLGFELRHFANGQLLFFKLGGHQHTPDGLGGGIVSGINLIDALDDAPDNDLIIIDEPELSLHPSFQRRMFDLLLAESARLQIIYSTHSPFMVEWSAIAAGARLARVFRPTNGFSTIAELKSETIAAITGLHENLRNPHILGTNAKEMFFLDDRVILVEGQDDVVYYRKMATELGIKIAGDFYGWGVGGADNMRKIAAVLRDLQYAKVIGLLDANRAAMVPQLESEFAIYEFRAIKTDDVRDKDSTDGKDVKGLCDSSGKVHPEHRDYVVQLFNQINSFLAS